MSATEKLIQSILDSSDPYVILGFRTTLETSGKDPKTTLQTSGEDVKSAFKKLALKIHPDKCSDPRANRAFVKVYAAFQEIFNSIGTAKSNTTVSSQEKWWERDIPMSEIDKVNGFSSVVSHLLHSFRV